MEVVRGNSKKFSHPSITLIFIFLFTIFSPVIEPGGKRIDFAEFYIYLVFFIGLKLDSNNPFSITFIIYFLGFILVTLFTAIMQGELLNNHDIYILRQVFQSFCAIQVFTRYQKLIHTERGPNLEYTRVLFWCSMTSLAPSLIVFLQKIDPFNFRNLVNIVYSPKFFFLEGDVFASYRYTSIFKDFFTAGTYFTFANFFSFLVLFYYPLEKKYKIILSLGILVSYLSQFLVARTSLIFIPICGLLLYFSHPKIPFAKKISKIPYLVLGVFILTSIGLYILDRIGINANWAFEAFSLVLGGEEQSGSNSYETLQNWNTLFFQNLLRDPTLLIRPLHTFSLSERSYSSMVYSDSFYIQEIYRYGLYGMFIYFVFLVQGIIIAIKKIKPVIFFFALCAIINYKGGNVFFLPKNIFLYSILLSLTPYFLLYQNQRYIHDQDSFSNPQPSIPPA